MADDSNRSVRLLCRSKQLNKGSDPGTQYWLVGSPFFPPLTIVSILRCIHILPSSSSPDLRKESEELRTLIVKGFEVIGALASGDGTDARAAIDAARGLRKLLYGERTGQDRLVIGAVSGTDFGDLQFFVSESRNASSLVSVTSIIHEQHPEKYVWENGCLLHCELPIKLPLYYPLKNPTDVEKAYVQTTEATIAKLRDPQAVYMLELEALNKTSSDQPPPVIIRGAELGFCTDLSNIGPSTEGHDAFDSSSLTCSYFSINSKASSPVFSVENADTIQVSVLFNSLGPSSASAAPVAEYLPVQEEARLVVVDIKLDVLCYSSRDLPLRYAISSLIIPGLVDQLNILQNLMLPRLLEEHPQLKFYHFSPPEILHPITVSYELNFGETEMKQVEVRRSLHSRLGLPYDRPLLRIANALDFSKLKNSVSLQKGSNLLRDVHIGIPSSGVTGGTVSLVQGSYEYFHYLQDGYNDSGWGCAYRSLQTIISWFRLQNYTSIEVPSHREIQQALVEIGDKDPSFIGSREWIGAIELSFVLDKLLGVTCKVINVRSGAELPEKCRELALHFENQSTPVMIGGGVLAYTLLGVDYNESSGDCAFLILDPHYTGTDDMKKIVNGGWCGWKKAVDNKGKNFFLHDKFYNLLLPQRPNMV